jgi:hypothetical protein
VSVLGRHVAGGLDPVRLAKRIGMDCDPWQKDVLRKRSTASLRAVTFTGSDKEKKSGAYSTRVPKRDLVTAV